VAGLAASFGSGAMTNSIGEFANAKCIFVMGSNTTETHPIISLQIKKAVKFNGAKLIVADPRRIDLVDHATVWLRHKSGTDVALLNGMMHVILKEGLADEEFIKTRTENFDELKAILPKYTPEYVAEITGVAAEDIIEAARIYATAETASIAYAMGVTQHITGVDNVRSFANLAMLTGNLGKPNVGVNPLRGQNNVQGACDMGALPDVYTAYQKVINPDAKAKFEQAWGVEGLSDKVGMKVSHAFDAITAGKIKGMYIMGENPMVSDPNLNHVEHALKELDFLVVQDIFMTPTAELADVVLPAASFAEKDGTFTNTERRVLRVRKAIEPVGNSKADWQIISEIATRCGYPMNYASAEEIFEEIRTVTPSYAGMTYARLDETGGLHWPCPTVDHPGTKYLHKDKFARGLGEFKGIEWKAPAENPDDEYPLILSTGRSLFHYHTGSMTRRAKAIDAHFPEGRVEINPVKAAELGIANGDKVKVATRRGEVITKAYLTDRVPEHTIFMVFHFEEAAANRLTNNALDPICGIPEYKVCAAKIEKVS